MKRICLILLVFVISISFTPAFAEEFISVYLDSSLISFTDITPRIINDRTMIPLRGIFEKLGATISWDNETKTITASSGTDIVKLTIGSDKALINDTEATLDSPPVIVNERTLVPLRFVSEALGAKVLWNGTTRTVHIFSKETISKMDYKLMNNIVIGVFGNKINTPKGDIDVTWTVMDKSLNCDYNVIGNINQVAFYKIANNDQYTLEEKNAIKDAVKKQIEMVGKFLIDLTDNKKMVRGAYLFMYEKEYMTYYNWSNIDFVQTTIIQDGFKWDLKADNMIP